MTYGINDFNYFPENQLTKFKLCFPNFLIFVSLGISVTHFASLGVPLDAVSSPSGSRQSPATKRILVHLEVKMKRFSGYFNRQNLKVLL